MNALTETYLPDMLHGLAMGLLVPAMAAILLLMALTLFFLGQWVAEFFCERRHFRQNMPRIVNEINDAPYDQVTPVVVRSGLLKKQKAALVTLAQNMGLPEEPLFSLAQIEINRVEKHYARRLAWTDTIAKVAPLLGLMGTLIPLGPGIVALGKGDVNGLSQSMALAFDATVCGLVCAVAALVVSKVRGGWYDEYVRSLESLVNCVVSKAADARAQGVALPANYCGDPLKEFVDVEGVASGAEGESPAQAVDAPAAAKAGE